MNRIILLFSISILFINCKTKEPQNQTVITSDIHSFWKAYDQIILSQDTSIQYQLLDSLFFRKGTAGLKAIRQARNYTPQDYLNSINDYPKFWSSIRENTLKADQISLEIESGIDKLRELYPELKLAKIYFTIGAFRTPGTTIDSLVLIGSEISMADSKTITDEFPEELSHLKTHYASNPKNHLVFLNVHEYIHTQQNPREFNILSLTIYEGIAEFISTIALNIDSPNPQIEHGKNNAKRIREVFEKEMFYPNNRYKWLDGNAPNEFGMRDLGYYVGFQISENFYNQAKNKEVAIKQMIELDYTNESEIESFVKKANYFSAPLDTLYATFENSRPRVVGIRQFKNGSQNVNPNIKEITVDFSEPLNGHNTGVDFGDLGQGSFPKNSINGRYWSKDNTSWTISVELEPDKRYQLLISNNFRTTESVPLKPLLIDFKTKE